MWNMNHEYLKFEIKLNNILAEIVWWESSLQ